MKPIVLTTLNSRYIHSSFSLRYLYANLGELQQKAVIKEFTIHDRAIDIAEKLLAMNPEIIGFSVYIWNVVEITEVIKLLKTIRPDIQIILGGPEVSHLPDQPDVVTLVDYVIKGAGESSFKALAKNLLQGQRPDNPVIQGIPQALEELIMPYEYYDDEDLRNRIIYVEASRGCPFKCEFCLSSLDKTSKTFTLDRFLQEMDKLYQKGARNFKFIDRTFNLKVAHSTAILQFFLDRLDDELMVHFEVIPDRLPDALKELLVKFPANSLQFEVGVQTFDPAVQTLISRRQNNEKTKENLLWLRNHTQAHIHADLIFGLPSDTLIGFADSFNQLYQLGPQEIQLGILKRLRGTPINRHSQTYQMKYSPAPPYTVLQTRDISFEELQRVGRFARYWDIFGNQGRFKHTLPLVMGSEENGQHFQRFMIFSDALFAHEKSTWKISLKRQFLLLHEMLPSLFGEQENRVRSMLQLDFDRSQQKGHLDSLLAVKADNKNNNANSRQRRHL
ncbi:B12-binding domain-containing radical SAM protein [Marinicella litoralis]|uniref:Radical SAM superfamily enzyme YgiQ (UPF0313 family) n=1 Tax=Marinicella litoralis TaxID=644220 RepID=A0A4R6XV74_9GAMM|nr:B12-binding domain-containing radical SAM protein [Marinicella litoralis]TDR23736.1 radical SAM superfamily enzyme YgiQ (UPF0313 family) [Marinicella litoralis]